MPQWLVRDYLARRGQAPFQKGQLVPSRCSLLGYAMQSITIEGSPIHRSFLQVDTQPEVGPAAYDAGAEILTGFFREQIRKFMHADLDPEGRKIIECCLAGGSVADFESLLPTSNA